MRIIICDDDAGDRNALYSAVEKYLREISSSASVDIYESGEALVRDYDSFRNDEAVIIFLDIYMPGISGIDTARKIREADKDAVIVFTTTSLDHGLDGYSVKALQYLVKPVKYPVLKDTLDDCAARFADSLRYIEVMSGKAAVRIPHKDFVYAEIFAHDCLIHTISRTVKCRHTLDDMERMLGGSAFLRTHRSFIVNMRYIGSVAENDFILTNGAMIPIRRNDKLAVKQAYMDYVFARARGERI